MPPATKSAKDIFLEAVEKTDPADRADYLREACGDDAELRRHVEALIRVHFEPDSLLDQQRIDPRLVIGGLGDPTINQLPAERAGTQIGPYKLLQQIGEGGMGVVYMAEQSVPVARRVALKIIKPGMDTRQVIARFEAERQALAMMDHPNIAKVFDAGCIGEPDSVSPGSPPPAQAGGSQGRPYFVMELVRGIPITKYCDEHHLTLKQRLELFLPVCQAVQHAHQKGIIHRDLKPSNVLVAQYDDKPVPKVIDFGVAKAAQKLTERTMFTEFGQVVGTLEYMSPEQARLNQLDIDTRSDIYSLGVLLYELLTGCTPFDGKRLRSAAFDEMLRIIREEDPPKPSTRLTSAATLPSIAACRSVEPARLGRTIRGELDWIVMKALEKDRNRRYETTNGLAHDIERYLRDEPVLACPPSTTYRLRKLARRNKGPLATAGLLATSLVAGLVLLAVSNIRLKAEQARTRAQEQRAQEQLSRADANLSIALEALDEVFLTEIEGRGYQQRQLSGDDRALIEKGLNFYEQFARQNAAHGALGAEAAKANRRLGYLWRELQQPREAEAAFTKAIPVLRGLASQFPAVADHRRELARCLDGQSVVRLGSQHDPEAEEMVKESIALWEELADASDSRDDQLGPGHALFHQGMLVYDVRRYDAAALPFTRALALFQRLSAEFPQERFYRQEVGFAHASLAGVYKAEGRLREAAEHARRSIAIYGALAAEEPGNARYLGEWAHSLRLLSEILTQTHEPQEAQAARHQLSEVQEKLVAPQRVTVAQRPADPWAHHALGDKLAQQGRLADAEIAYQEALRLEPNNSGRHHNYADVLRGLRKFDEAATEYAHAARLSSAPFASYHGLASVYATMGQWTKAGPALEETVRLSPSDHSLWFRMGTLCLYTHDTENYRRSWGEMLHRFAQTEDVQIAERVAKLGALSQEFGADPAQLEKLIDRSMANTQTHPARKWFEITKGLVNYRAGRFVAAADIILHSAPSSEGFHRDALAFSICAMAQQRLGQLDNARINLSNAQQIITTRMPKVEREDTFNDDWPDWLQCDILCREAEELLGGLSSPEADVQDGQPNARSTSSK